MAFIANSNLEAFQKHTLIKLKSGKLSACSNSKKSKVKKYQKQIKVSDLIDERETAKAQTISNQDLFNIDLVKQRPFYLHSAIQQQFGNIKAQKHAKAVLKGLLMAKHISSLHQYEGAVCNASVDYLVMLYNSDDALKDGLYPISTCRDGKTPSSFKRIIENLNMLGIYSGHDWQDENGHFRVDRLILIDELFFIFPSIVRKAASLVKQNAKALGVKKLISELEEKYNLASVPTQTSASFQPPQCSDSDNFYLEKKSTQGMVASEGIKNNIAKASHSKGLATKTAKDAEKKANPEELKDLEHLKRKDLFRKKENFFKKISDLKDRAEAKELSHRAELAKKMEPEWRWTVFSMSDAYAWESICRKHGLKNGIASFTYETKKRGKAYFKNKEESELATDRMNVEDFVSNQEQISSMKAAREEQEAKRQAYQEKANLKAHILRMMKWDSNFLNAEYNVNDVLSIPEIYIGNEALFEKLNPELALKLRQRLSV